MIIGFQLLFRFVDFQDPILIALDQSKITSYQAQLDRLRNVSSAEKKFKIYPFNPNYISDFKGYQLGMKPTEIDRLFAYRNKNLFVNNYNLNYHYLMNYYHYNNNIYHYFHIFPYLNI